ncbi:hypothetical protein W03_06520 [Nitrosomonas sp. PY1]|uniref:hypothetical protein n=1 Tax=Nitrosomonas sp. PY1 TaxID=1803906 RepID=UPI001FC81269|nr:hypothetical protein [Nitrosomonas sp. PY1]GKS68648.1 hypothetical protein W03_06520 [Nitrosomonas sp. PY1]
MSACSSVPQKQDVPLQPEDPSPLQTERPAGPLPPSARPKYNLSGYPLNTQQGYIDGCETAKNSSWAFKDLNRYDRDDQYRMGWDDGFALCKMTK